jgi:glycosyltransferase involved in cell wall biosynthesis
MTANANPAPAGCPAAVSLPAARIAVLVPCRNEELTIAKVVGDFRAQLPAATIYVCDNASTDRTAEVARQAGAVVMRQARQGKGFAIQSMFRAVEADVYVMVDGDDTYPASEVHRLLEPVLNGTADMAVGSRLHADSTSEFRRANLFGNQLFLATLNFIFHVRLTDILSGYRAFSRQFVKTIVLVSGGFELETEVTIKGLQASYGIVEVPVDLGRRPEGSRSKIRPLHDGFRILSTIIALFRDYKPLTFFGTLALIFWGAGLVPGAAVIVELLNTGMVTRVLAAILSVGLVLSGMFSLTAGLIIHCTTRRFYEVERHLRSLVSNIADEDHSPGVRQPRELSQ